MAPVELFVFGRGGGGCIQYFGAMSLTFCVFVCDSSVWIFASLQVLEQAESEYADANPEEMEEEEEGEGEVCLVRTDLRCAACLL